MIHKNILDTIGNTPLVFLSKLSDPKGGTVIVKMESHNPGGSVKDRIAWNMIEEAEKQGVLKPGMTIVEPTSRKYRHRACHGCSRERVQSCDGYA